MQHLKTYNKINLWLVLLIEFHAVIRRGGRGVGVEQRALKSIDLCGVSGVGKGAREGRGSQPKKPKWNQMYCGLVQIRKNVFPIPNPHVTHKTQQQQQLLLLAIAVVVVVVVWPGTGHNLLHT